MDKEGQSEVTSKLRSAIKQKLSEISDFVDDELPEYIMILVANQRSKSQIEKDLSLFLRDDTVIFTNWLWDLLNNINPGSKNIHSSLPRNDTNLSKRKDVEIDEDAIVLDCDPDEKENDLLSHNGDTSDSNLSVPPVPHSSSHAYDDIMKEASKLNSRSHIAIEKDKKEDKLPERKYKKYPQPPREPLSSKIVSVKKRLVDSDDEYDPTKPEYMSKSHIATPRNYGGPAALQRNKLLLKAVDDATKSILDGKNIEEYYKPTPIKVLTSKRFQSKYPPKRDDLPLNKKTEYDFTPQPDFNSDVSQNSGFQEQEFANVCMENNCMESPVSVHKNRTICLRNIPLIPDSIEHERANYTATSTPEYSFPTVEEVRPKSPHFIVTLEGVNLPSFKRKLEDNSIDSMEEDDDDNVLSDEYDEDSPSSKKLKMNERCKYWPACKNSDYCSYHHPAVPCKSFPDCKFGDKCLYIHPNCKFDALCSRKDCPFTHASKRKLPLTTPPVRMFPVQNRKVKTVCKFYPKCTAKNCPFIHPKLCRYGTNCQLPVCVYSHFPLPSRSQLKWQASVS